MAREWDGGVSSCGVQGADPEEAEQALGALAEARNRIKALEAQNRRLDKENSQLLSQRDKVSIETDPLLFLYQYYIRLRCGWQAQGNSGSTQQLKKRVVQLEVLQTRSSSLLSISTLLALYSRSAA